VAIHSPAWSRRALLLGAAGLRAQEVEWTCPMDPDVRQKGPGKCPRCGMPLELGLPEALEYPVRITTAPRAARASEPMRLLFRVFDPRTKKPATKFKVIHEKLFHLFLVREGLTHFAHEHPEPQADGSFVFDWNFPAGGEWRLACDFYPEGGTPQMVTRTLLLPEAPPRAATPEPRNLRVSLATEPARPFAGRKTLLHFTLDPVDGFTQWLGAWGHLLIASEDLVDLIHTHPFLADGGPRVQFNVIFPRPGTYKLWAQFERRGVVNTMEFSVNVRAV
jgi:hypothetical protein